MGTLDGRNDAFRACQLIAGTDGFIVIDAQHLCASLLSHIAVHRPHTWIIQSGRDGEGFLDLSVIILHHQHLCTMQNTYCASMDGGCRIVGIPTVSASFSQYDFYALVIHIVIDGSCGVGASSDAGHEVVRIIASDLFFQLPFDFFGDHTLHSCHQVGVGVWSHC